MLQNRHDWPHACAAASFSLCALSLCAQTAAAPSPAPNVVPVVVPDSVKDMGDRELLRNQERQRAIRAQQESAPDVQLESPLADGMLERLPDAEPACMNVRVIRLVGDSAERFQWAVARVDRLADDTPDPAVGRCLGTQGMNLVMRRIQNALMVRGFVAARVLASSQSQLNHGTLELTLFPGHIRQIRFAAGTDSRATQWNALPMKAGDLLNLRDVEQALENLKRVPTVEADVQVEPAEGANAAPGQSDLVIRWTQRFPLRLSLSLDDSGSKATGKHQVALTLSLDHPLMLNDLFYVSINRDLGGSLPGARGTHGHALHYSLPVGPWLLAFSAGGHRFHQSVAGANQTYVYSGESENAEFRLSRLIHRDAHRRSTISVAAWMRRSRNFIEDVEVEVQRRRMGGLDFGVSHRAFIGSSTIDLGLNHRRGTGAFDSQRAPEEAFNEGTSRPQIISANAQLNVPFKVGSQGFRYLGSWRAQWNRTPLVPQDRFAIGSRYSVRGFDGERQLVAERGWLVRNDLGWVAGPAAELYLGVDYGEVGGRSSAFLIGQHLGGAVLGLRGATKALSYDVFSGRPFTVPSGFRSAGTVVGASLNLSF